MGCMSGSVRSIFKLLLTAAAIGQSIAGRAADTPARLAACKIAPIGETESRAPNPRVGGVFRASCGVDIDEHGTLVRRFVVHAPSREHLPFAERAGRFLGLLWSLGDRHFGTLCSRLRERPVEVWLSLEGEAGGEQINQHLYVYDLLSSRSGLEWARELAHEYGHYLLPGASGYAEPENWANGVLGERLFLSWIREAVGAKLVDSDQIPWVSTAEIDDYCAKQVDPLTDKFCSAPPDITLLSAKDKKAFNAFTGLMLYADSVYGEGALMKMLAFLPLESTRQPHGQDFLAALTSWINDQSTLRITLPKSGSAYLWLPKGRFTLRPVSGTVNSLKLEKAAAMGGGAGVWQVIVPVAGWRVLTLSGSGRTALLEKLG